MVEGQESDGINTVIVSVYGVAVNAFLPKLSAYLYDIWGYDSRLILCKYHRFQCMQRLQFLMRR